MDNKDIDISGLLYLCSVPRLGPLRIRALMSRFESPEKILSASARKLAEVPGIDLVIAKNIKTAVNKELAERQIDRAKSGQTQIISFWDEQYPPLLKETADAPILLFVKGEINPQDYHAIAIVGTRSPDSYGRIVSDQFGEKLVQAGLTIVSGLARGVDTYAHQSAIKAKGRTIAVLGSGVDIIYPPENAFLAEKIIQNGALISEFPMGTKPDATNFPRRNRIIAGLCLGTLVVEAGRKSGALITATYAIDNDREVFAIPGNITSPKSIGTNKLIQEGAKLVTSVEDILEGLGSGFEFSGHISYREPEETFNPLELKILESLSDQPVHIDKISELNELDVSHTLAALLTLELGGYIKQLAGKMFVRI